MQEGKSGYIQVCDKESRQSDHQRSGIKLRNLAFCVRADASLWARWIHSLHMQLSLRGQSCVLVHLASCIPSSSAIMVGGGSIPWFAVLEALIHIWRPEIADGCDISCSLIWLRYFHFTVGSAVKNPPANKSLRRHKFYPWVGKIPWGRKWQPTPVFLPGESPWTEQPGRIQSIGSQKSRIGLKRLSTQGEEGEAADTRGTSKEKSAVL